MPSVLSWKVMDTHNNLYNTQCMFAIWAMKTITDGLIQQGGLKIMEEKVLKRAADVRFRFVLRHPTVHTVNTSVTVYADAV